MFVFGHAVGALDHPFSGIDFLETETVNGRMRV